MAMAAQQEQWRSMVVQQDTFDLKCVRLVGGLDIQWDANGCTGHGVLTVLSFPDCALLHTEIAETHTEVPWQSGFLGFRECPCYRNLLQMVKQTAFQPDVCLVDGFGVLHPRGCGSASQLGILSDTPTIGVAKSLLQPACKLSEQQVKNDLHTVQKLTLDLTNEDELVVGCAFRRSLDVRQPVYVAVGHKCSLYTACRIVEQCCKYRIPEPIRQADMKARAMAREYAGKVPNLTALCP